MQSLIKIRLLGTGRPEGWSHPRIIFDPGFSQGECAGVLCWGAFSAELANYRGVKAWYYPEPRYFSRSRRRHFEYALSYLAPHEFLHFSNSDSKFRLPIVTHYSPIQMNLRKKIRTQEIVAVVSNFGGRAWWFRPGARLRNAFICRSEVDLYGSVEAWSTFQRWPWSRPAPPSNFRGRWPSNWYRPEHVEMLSEYRFVVCLENSCEPHYFTEKFVNAARAGCVPIYQAHPTVRQSILRGATWIDPANYSFDVDETFEAARRCDRDTIVRGNLEWLNTEEVKKTDGYFIWSKIAEYFERRILEGGQYSGV